MSYSLVIDAPKTFLPLNNDTLEKLVGEECPEIKSRQNLKPRQKGVLFRVDKDNRITDLEIVWPYKRNGVLYPRILTIDKVYGKHITFFQCPVSYLTDTGESVITNRMRQKFWNRTIFVPVCLT